jgi:glyoxylase-like metal-dependent hydrolase (beta-lactamase superfamily II)
MPATGDLVVYPGQWIGTLGKLLRFNAATVLPGHGPVMHDQSPDEDHRAARALRRRPDRCDLGPLHPQD